MKLKTMLRFLLCFLIIGTLQCKTEVFAAPTCVECEEMAKNIDGFSSKFNFRTTTMWCDIVFNIEPEPIGARIKAMDVDGKAYHCWSYCSKCKNISCLYTPNCGHDVKSITEIGVQTQSKCACGGTIFDNNGKYYCVGKDIAIVNTGATSGGKAITLTVDKGINLSKVTKYEDERFHASKNKPMYVCENAASSQKYMWVCGNEKCEKLELGEKKFSKGVELTCSKCDKEARIAYATTEKCVYHSSKWLYKYILNGKEYKVCIECDTKPNTGSTTVNTTTQYWYCTECKKATAKKCTTHKDYCSSFVGKATGYTCACNRPVYYDGSKYCCAGYIFYNPQVDEWREKFTAMADIEVSEVYATYRYEDNMYYATPEKPRFFCDWSKDTLKFTWACVECSEEVQFEKKRTFNQGYHLTCNDCNNYARMVEKRKGECPNGEHKNETLLEYIKDGKVYIMCKNCAKKSIAPTQIGVAGNGSQSDSQSGSQNGLQGGSQNGSQGGSNSSSYISYTVGGPAIDHFFEAGTFLGVKGKAVIDSNMGPVLHLQSLIMFFATVAAVIIVLIYAIQWMMATSQKRQELKAGMWPLILGVMLLILGPRLIPVVYEAFLYEGGDVVEHTNRVSGTIISAIQSVGYIIAIIMILLIGIQYLLAVPNKRQELKGRMINLIIGAMLLVGGVTLLGWIAEIAENDVKYDAMLPQEIVEEHLV